MASNTHGPRTYAQWSECLDRLAKGSEDEICLGQMRAGELLWTGGVASLFAQRMADEFNARLIRCSEHLARDLRAVSDEGSIVRAIINARQALNFLHRLAQLPSFAETLRTHLTGEVRAFAERSQRSLEDSSRTDRTGRLALVLRNNNLLRYETLAGPDAPGMGAPTLPSAAATVSPSLSGVRRRNILT